MSRDKRLTTKTQRGLARDIPVRDFDNRTAFACGVSHHKLLDDIDARIEREKKLRELLCKMAEWHIGDTDECGEVAREAWRILAETANDE